MPGPTVNTPPAARGLMPGPAREASFGEDAHARVSAQREWEAVGPQQDEANATSSDRLSGSERLRAFLADRASDPQKFADLIYDFDAAVQAAGLGPTEIAAMTAGDSHVVEACLAGGLPPELAAQDGFFVSPPTGVPAGSLVVVGTGIRSVGQLTMEAVSHLSAADCVLHLVCDPVTEAVIRKLNPRSETLTDLYETDKLRGQTYAEMTERIIERVRAGQRVCAAFYGHPGVFCTTAHSAIRRAREEGYPAWLLPAVSAEDCLFADLGIEPGLGCQTYSATGFLDRAPRWDRSTALILFRLNLVGDHTNAGPRPGALASLRDRLVSAYPSDHPVCGYRAAMYPGCPPIVQETTLDRLADINVHLTPTLYVPALTEPEADPEVAYALSMSEQDPPTVKVVIQDRPSRARSGTRGRSAQG